MVTTQLGSWDDFSWKDAACGVVGVLCVAAREAYGAAGEKAALVYSEKASDIERRAAAAGAAGARGVIPDIDQRIEPLKQQAKLMTYVLVGTGVVLVAATGTMIYFAARRGRR